MKNFSITPIYFSQKPTLFKGRRGANVPGLLASIVAFFDAVVIVHKSVSFISSVVQQATNASGPQAIHTSGRVYHVNVMVIQVSVTQVQAGAW